MLAVERGMAGTGVGFDVASAIGIEFEVVEMTKMPLIMNYESGIEELERYHVQASLY